MLRRPTITALLGIVLLGAAACSQPETPDQGTPEQTTSSAPTSTAQGSQIPNPKNLKAVTDACTLLTPNDLSEIGGGGEPEAQTSSYGETQCDWQGENYGVGVAVNTKFGGPEKIFSKSGVTQIEVAGYPAGKMDETTSLCRIEVAVADDQNVEIDYTKLGGKSPEMQDTCGYAQRLAEAVLKNIPA